MEIRSDGRLEDLPIPGHRKGCFSGPPLEPSKTHRIFCAKYEFRVWA